MISSVTRVQTALHLAACTVLAAAAALPLGALAAGQPVQATNSKKPVAARSVDTKKSTSVKVVSQEKIRAAQSQNQSQSQSKLARSSKGGEKSPPTAKSMSSQKKALLAKSAQRVKTASGKKDKKALQLANAPKRKTGKDMRLAKNGRERTGMALVAHSRPAAVGVPHFIEPRLSTGERLGLRGSQDALDLNSSVALVVDQDTSEVLFSKNDTAVLPIASLTKLMTGLVIADANLSMDEMISITEEDAQVYRNSRLAVGTTLTRGELMHLALMSSENRAANALGRTYPGGGDQFVRRMNAKASELGMRDTRYVEPTGLSSQNQSSARDLATLVSVAYDRPILRNLSTSPGHQLELGHRTLRYNNSNRLVRSPEWEIGLQKTGYISEAGRCLVMQAKVSGRKLIMVFLDSAGKLGRSQDAERVRRWVEAQTYVKQFAQPQG